FVSLINLASLRSLAAVLGRKLDPRRFRANIYLEGLEPWAELGLVGRTIRIGDARLEILKRIERCAATNVEPTTGERDLDIPGTLLRTLGHRDCGVYARIAAGGTITA